ncbi:MAG: amylo-alpha-1,6-glucosidase, partial [Rhodothermia bacterium]
MTPSLIALIRSAVSVLLLAAFAGDASAQHTTSPLDDLTKQFDGLRGQLQIGGPFVGLEFHHSRPAPSRLSFYYPVANSIDLSTDYWRRDESMPFSIKVAVNGVEEDLAAESLPYRWTPANAVFEKASPTHRTLISYRFGETLPIVVIQIDVTNLLEESVQVDLTTSLATTLRTSHAYTWRDTASVRYSEHGSVYRADFDAQDTGNATVFVVNAGATPSASESSVGMRKDPFAEFAYSKTLGPGDKLQVIQLIGSSHRSESMEIVRLARMNWRKEVMDFERRVADFVDASSFSIDDASLIETARWSKAIQQVNRHPLEGHRVPMPSPAQYNFFFTHDLLLTDLGVVQFDTALVRHDLRYLLDLDRGDHVLTHARYWRDDAYVSEIAGSDNWNHLWFVLLTSSYLKHSGDGRLVGELSPLLSRSIELMLENFDGGLMHGERPDWWDIGHVYGAKAYLTILTIRAIRAYAYIVVSLGLDDPRISEYMARADLMQTRLTEELWDDKAGYLLNRLDNEEVDRHLYMGSLLAVVFDLVDDAKKLRMLETARRELLDPEIGLRTVAPTDFHEQIERYRFQGLEMGLPGRYINGGVWPHGNAWYAMALMAAGEPDSALAAVKRYYTLDGIESSPGGQPALYEYRRTDSESPAYGELDKTTFLWAGGWYLSLLYQLAGVRESEWNIRFDPDLPSGFEEASFDIMAAGRRMHVQWHGRGEYFKRILVDGLPAYSTVIVEPLLKPFSEIDLIRGRPETPYLERA